MGATVGACVEKDKNSNGAVPIDKKDRPTAAPPLLLENQRQGDISFALGSFSSNAGLKNRRAATLGSPSEKKEQFGACWGVRQSGVASPSLCWGSRDECNSPVSASPRLAFDSGPVKINRLSRVASAPAKVDLDECRATKSFWQGSATKLEKEVQALKKENRNLREQLSSALSYRDEAHAGEIKNSKFLPDQPPATSSDSAKRPSPILRPDDDSPKRTTSRPTSRRSSFASSATGEDIGFDSTAGNNAGWTRPQAVGRRGSTKGAAPRRNSKVRFDLDDFEGLDMDSDDDKEAPAEQPELINLIIQAAWPFISSWFQQKMRETVEPALQEKMPAGMIVAFGEAHLGTAPPELQNIVTTTYVQPGHIDGEDIKNVRVIADLEYRGNCTIEATLSAGKIIITDMTVTSVVVIELIRLVPSPPFFSGIRLYFPNAPEVNVKVGSQLLGMEMNSEFVKSKIVQSLSDVLARAVVLPNCLAHALAQDIDTFPLAHPRPQGILRLSFVAAKDLRDPGSKLKVDPYVLATVGSTRHSTPPASSTFNPEWGAEATFDFFVMDWLAQILHVEVRDAGFGLFGRQTVGDFLGRADVTIADLVQGQDGSNPCDRWLPLESEDLMFSGNGNGEIHLLAQWRPFAHVRSITAAVARRDNYWSLGVPASSAWMLFVGVYGASMLPPRVEGTQHWVSVSADADSHDRNGAQVAASGETKRVAAFAPVQKSIDALSSLGVAPKLIAQTLDVSEAEVLRYRRQRGGTESCDADWTRGKSGAESLMNVTWNKPVMLLLPYVRSVKLTATVMRKCEQGGGVLSGVFTPSVQEEAVCSMTYKLDDLFQCDRLTTVGEFPLDQGMKRTKGPTPLLKLRIQIRPLMPPAAVDGPGVERDRLRRTHQTNGAMRTPVGGKTIRRNSALTGFTDTAFVDAFQSPNASDADDVSQSDSGSSASGERMLPVYSCVANVNSERLHEW